MSEFLKGTYDVDKEIVEEETENSAQDEFKKKALNSIGGSMVFVEREIYTWTGDEEESPE